MYSLTLEINQKCNLKCKYCYLQKKNGSEMKKEVLFAAIDFGIKNASNHADKRLAIDFIGGEPLINFDIIQSAVTYAKDKAKFSNIELLFMITTNALLLNEDIIGYFVDERFNLKVSIDGSEEINDINRIYHSGRGSYNDVLMKMPLVKKFEQMSKRVVQVTNVVTKNNY